MYFAQDVFDFAQSIDFDEGTFQAYQAIGRNLSSLPDSPTELDDLRARLFAEVHSKLDNLNFSLQLSTGLSIENLWSRLRPSVATNTTQLYACLKLEELADRLDAVRWNSGASVQEFLEIQKSLVGAYVIAISLESTKCNFLRVWEGGQYYRASLTRLGRRKRS